MALPGTTLLSSVALGTAVRGGLRLASKRGWLPRGHYQRQILASLKQGELGEAFARLAVLRKKVRSDEGVAIVADLIRMRLDSEISRLRKKCEEAQEEHDEISRAMQQLRGGNGQERHLPSLVRFAPVFLVASLNAVLLFRIVERPADPASWSVFLVLGLVAMVVGRMNLRQYRRHVKKQRWLLESRFLQLDVYRRRLDDIAETIAANRVKMEHFAAYRVTLDEMTATDNSNGVDTSGLAAGDDSDGKDRH